VYGGSVAEAMQDLVKLLASLNTADGGIAVPGISDLVRPMTAAERERYTHIDFDPEGEGRMGELIIGGHGCNCPSPPAPTEFRKEFGAPNALRFDTKEGVLSHRWRYPTLSIHGIEGAFAGPGSKTVIPHKVRQARRRRQERL